jgi:uncharacterized protein (TIGR01777 family)
MDDVASNVGMRILVAGGSGFLGTALSDALRREGHQVTNLTRTPRHHQDLAWLPQAGGAALPVNDTDVIVNLAGESIAGGRWTPARKAAIRGSRVAATRALAEAIRAARRPPSAFLSGSGIDIYPASTSETATEDTPPGSSFLASVCREWEAEALVAAGRTRVILLRTALVLARHGGALPQIARPFWFFAGGTVGPGGQPVSWIHLEDWVAMVQWAIARTAISGPLNVAAPNPVTNREMAKALGRVLHRPAFVPAPAAAMRLALGEMADALLLTGRRVAPAKALAHGFAFRYPELEGALRALYRAASAPARSG